MTACSCRALRLADGLGVAVDDQEIGAGRSLRHAAALLPMAQRIDAEPELPGELFMGQLELGPDRLDLDISAGT